MRIAAMRVADDVLDRGEGRAPKRPEGSAHHFVAGELFELGRWCDEDGEVRIVRKRLIDALLHRREPFLFHEE